MSGYYTQPDPDEQEFAGNSGGGLRKMLEETLAENKKLLDKLNERERGKTTADLLKGKGLDPAIAEIIPEGADPSEWVDKYAHLLGVAKNTPDETPAAEPELQLADDTDPALAAERERLAAMNDAQESGTPPVYTDAMERLEKVDSEDELMKLIAEEQTKGG